MNMATPLSPMTTHVYEKSMSNGLATLVVGNFFHQSRGRFALSKDIARRLRELGWPVTMTSERLPKIARLADMVVTTWETRRDYEVAHVDVFSGSAFVWAEAVCLALRLAHKPYVLTLRGGALPEFSRRWPARVSRLLRSAAAVTVPSEYLKDHMREFHDAFRVIPNALEIERYPFRLRSQPERQLMWLRAFDEGYNPLLVPEVLARLAPSAPDVSCTMGGPDKGDGSLGRTRAAADRLGVAARINFPGGVAKEDVPAWLDGADIFINTTNVDNMPVSVMEAMACGMCVVSTNVGGLPYLLENEKDALLVPPNDAPALAAAIERLWTDPDLARRLSANARIKAERHDWSVVLPQWTQLLSEVGNRQRLPPIHLTAWHERRT